MTTERTLYFVNGSIPNWRVMMALHEKGLAFTPRRLRVMSEPRETRSPEFLAINPRGKTPVLVEPDGTRINESLAILTYLELRYPEPSLLPRGEPGALARVLALTQEAETFACAYEPLEQLFVEKPEALSDSGRKALAEALAAVRFELSLWESRAAAGAFIAGEDFTLADCAFYPVLAYLLRRGLSLEDFPRLAAYEQRVRARPSAVASYPEGWTPGAVGRKDLFRLARAAIGPASSEGEPPVETKAPEKKEPGGDGKTGNRPNDRLNALFFARPARMRRTEPEPRTDDLTSLGVRIYSDDEHKVGGPLELDLFLRDGSSVQCMARVAWTQKLPSGRPACFDVGLVLFDLSPETRARIERELVPDDGGGPDGSGSPASPGGSGGGPRRPAAQASLGVRGYRAGWKAG